jgi:hypothetical protein
MNEEGWHYRRRKEGQCDAAALSRRVIPSPIDRPISTT